MLKSWLNVYYYHWFKNKIYFVLTVLGLSFGISLLTLAVLNYHDEHAYEQWNPNKDQLFMVLHDSGDFAYINQPFPLGRTLKENYAFVEDFIYYTGYNEGTIEKDKVSYTLKKIFLSQRNFFDFFPFSFVYGSAATALQDQNSLVLEEQKAIEIFGRGVNPLGREVYMEEEWRVVTGVFTLDGQKSSFMPDAIVAGMDQLVAAKTNWQEQYFGLLIKTSKPDQALVAIRETMDQHYFIPMAKEGGITVEELKENQLLNTPIVLSDLGGVRLSKYGKLSPEGSANLHMMYIFWGLAVVIFSLALINFINFSITQFLLRMKELGLRRILGGSSRYIVQQIVVETALTLTIALVISFFCMGLMLPYVNQMVDVQLEMPIGALSICFLLLLISMSLLTGSIIAFYVTKQPIISILKGNFIASKNGRVLKKVFLILQLAIASFFISSTLIFNQQVHYMLNKDLGFKGDQVISFSFNEELRWTNNDLLLEKYEVLKNEMQKIPGVEGISASDQVFGRSSSASTSGKLEGKELVYTVVQIDFGFFELFQIPLVKGRDYNPMLASDSIQHLVVNETFVRAIDGGDPLGKSLKALGRSHSIIGVVKDYNFKSLEEEVTPTAYYYMNGIEHKMGSIEKIYVKIKAGDKMEQTIQAVEKTWSKFNLNPDIPFQYEFVDRQFAKTFDRVLLERQVFNFLSIGVVFIALFGLLALVTFALNGKLKEVAIRKVLGANTRELIQKLSFQYLMYCMIGFGLSIFPSYYLLEHWLSEYAYRIDIGWEVFGLSCSCIVLLTLLVVLQKTRKAVHLDVLHYIKYE